MDKPIRVLHVVTHMNRGGLETMIMNYYRNIDRNKVQFDFLTHRSYDGDYGEEIKQLGGKLYHLPVLNPWNKKYRDSLEDFFGTHREYKIVHVHQDCMSSVILKVAKKYNVKVRIAHSHCASQDKNLKYLIKWIYKKQIIKYATKLMACGYEAGLWMFETENFQIINNAIDARKYVFNANIRKKIRKELNVDEHTFLVGHIGRFSHQKNHEFLLKIFKEISMTRKSKLILIGNDIAENGKLIHQLVTQYNLDENVIFTGVRNDIPDLLQAMDVFVFPSYYEGLPVSLIEAQAAGVHCYISDTISNESIVTNIVKQISLSANEFEWANSILIEDNYKHENMLENIKKAGFDIIENSLKLQEYYINAISNI